MLGLEELLGAVAGEGFDDVGELATTVVALAGVAFGIFVGKDARGGLKDGFRGEVLAGDQLQAGVLPVEFLLDGFIEGGVGLGQGA